MISFFNTFISYVLLALIITAVAGVALAIGITLRKRKDSRQEVVSEENMVQE